MTPTSSPSGVQAAVTVRNHRRQALEQLRQYLGAPKVADLERCAERFVSVLPHQDKMEANIVVAMYGGGKDSSFLVAAVRFMQLATAERRGSTFRVRIVTNRHSGMPVAVMQNIWRVYTALGMNNDLDVELLLVDGNAVCAFDPGRPIPHDLLIRDRTTILMSGHRCQADSRPTFCNSCNLAMENALALALGHGDPAHVILTGDSPAELRNYVNWVRRAARDLDVRPPRSVNGFGRFIHRLGGIAHNLNRELFRDIEVEVAERALRVQAVTNEPVFFSIYEDTTYAARDHWELLTKCLDFRFDEIAFAFTESDCGNPALMAHLHGLRHERLLGQTYETGIREYASYAIGLMRKKEFPNELVDVMIKRYATPADIVKMRRTADAYAYRSFLLSNDQLVCMIYSPFTQEGEHLRTYLRAEKPELLDCEPQIRALLGGAPEEEHRSQLGYKLEELSGLEIPYLRVLYRSALIASRKAGAAGNDPISIILRDDPHKAVVQRTTGGETVDEFITGR